MLNQADVLSTVEMLCSLPHETEWAEWKENDERPDDIGEYLSALSNSAALLGRQNAYLLWGVQDGTGTFVGTKFKQRDAKVGAQELESWLIAHLRPALDFRFYEGEKNGLRFVLLEIPACTHTPVLWKGVSFIRVGSYKKRLNEFPEKERTLWRMLGGADPFEKHTARQGASTNDVLSWLNFAAYYDLTKQTLPKETSGILERLVQERMIQPEPGGRTWSVTNFGALLMAKKLSDFSTVWRKAVRVITYAGSNRTSGRREHISDEGYACGFEALVAYINGQLSINEHIGQAFRITTPTYPEIAIRELVANAMLHQDLTVSGSSPMVEIFTDRMEITNPGRPLIDPLRFADEPPRSRNEDLGAFMRRIEICEELGSGIDKVLGQIELFQLPAPNIEETSGSMRVTLFAKRPFLEMNSAERVRACYWHACLLYVSRTQMTNDSLRRRFGLAEGKHNQVGRIISDARKANLIKPYDPENCSPRYARYVPSWA